MIVKYKVTDFAKDTGLSVKKILDTLTQAGIKDKKNSSTLEEKELNLLLDRLSSQNSEADLSAFLNSARPEPKQSSAASPRTAKRAPAAAAAPSRAQSSSRPKSTSPRPRPTRSGTKRPSPSVSWAARPAPRPLPPNRCRSSARTTR